MPQPHVIILGAGPAGLGAAYRLARAGQAHVTVLEANTWVGGNAGSFELAGLRVDYGSHRLHPACPPDVLADIRALLGDDLLDRPRHGRIRLQGRWIHFPLKPADLMLRLPPRFALGVMGDALSKPFTRNGHAGPESYASVLEAGLGKTICREFYFPYGRKLWGLPPQELAAQQARRRVSAGSLGRMARKVLSAVPGLKPKGAGRFFYPRRGYGQISEAYSQAAQAAGARVMLGTRVEAVEAGTGGQRLVRYTEKGQSAALHGDYVWSTIPITALARSLQPAPPQDLVQAAGQIGYRAMILIYLVLGADRFTEYDAHYFPEEEIAISRLSEPKNYVGAGQPPGSTVLCAELPCAPDGPEWQMTDAELQGLLLRALETAGIPVQAPLRGLAVRRLRHAYPIYRAGYEQHFDRLDDWLGSVPGLLTFGRQGLFAHDNTHHALYMGYCAAACLRPDGGFDGEQWARFRHEFRSHVVED